LILLGLEAAALGVGLLGLHVLAGAPQTATQNPTRQVVSANILGYAIDPSAMAAFSGCLASDTGCTMEVIICYGVHGAAAGTAPLGCVPLRPNSYDTAVYLERAGGTELPNGALSGPVAYAEVQVATQ
jgi:hypothetical protein